MLSPSQIQFRMLTTEAQRAALQRLAFRGCDIKTISMQTGMPEADVRSHLDVIGQQPQNSTRHAVSRDQGETDLYQCATVQRLLHIACAVSGKGTT